MIGKRLKHLRLKNNCSLTKLSRLAGISKSYLIYLERHAQQLPPLPILVKIAYALNISIETLVGDQENVKLDDRWKTCRRARMDKDMEVEFPNFNTFKSWLEKREY